MATWGWIVIVVMCIIVVVCVLLVWSAMNLAAGLLGGLIGGLGGPDITKKHR